MFRIALAIVVAVPALGFATDVQPSVAADRAFLMVAPPHISAWPERHALSMLDLVMMRMTTNRSMTTEDSIEALRKMLKHVRKGPVAVQFRERIKVLRRNLAEERDRPAVCVRLLLRPTTHDRVADLIYYLRYSSRPFFQY
jgi:hypothetical protein